nr:insulinase family protein [Pyrinomonadaceae bacterium]
DADLSAMGANTGSISVSSVNPNEAVRAMLGEIQKLQQGSADQDSIDQMSGYFLTTHYLKQETNAAQAGDLAQYELIGGGWRNSFEFLDRIRKVKAADVQAVANKYMKNLQFTIVGDPKRVDRSVFVSN